MIREYEDKRIYKNLRKVRILSIISLILSVIGVVGFILQKYLVNPSMKPENAEIMFYFFAILLPIGYLFNTRTPPKSSSDKLKESKVNNDFSITLNMALMPIIALVGMIGAGMGNGFIYGIRMGFSYFGGLTASQLFYISNIFLIHNCVLIKREWKKNPPLWYTYEKIKTETIVEIERKNKEAKQDEWRQEECERLLSRVGKRFFVEYYAQLKEWDELDILDELRGRYEEETAKKRISAGKEVFQQGLEQYALKAISTLSEDKIDAETKRKAKELMEQYEIMNVRNAE